MFALAIALTIFLGLPPSPFPKARARIGTIAQAALRRAGVTL
jgi:hypothetical protein